MKLTPWLRAGIPLFAVAWGGNEFTPLLVMYRQMDGLSTQMVDILLGAYVLGIIPGLLLGGPLSDRFGRKPLMLPAPLFAILGSATLALAGGDPTILFTGRVFSGIALGLAMAVGTSWVKELSSPPVDPSADAGAGARRAAMSLTIGFGLGAAVAGAAAQWAPMPATLPYLINIVLLVISFLMLGRAHETRPRESGQHYGWHEFTGDLRIPSATHRRFLYVVAPVAPWVFGCAASAYAILPTLMAPHVRHFEVGYSALLCLIALGCGVAVQPLAKRIDNPANSMSSAVALIATIAGMGAAVGAVLIANPWLTAIAACILGAAYGLLLVSGLQEIQRIAGPDDLAGLTAVYYSISYLGFFIPAILAALSAWFSYAVLFGAGCVLAAACLGIVAIGWSRHLPEPIEVTE